MKTSVVALMLIFPAVAFGDSAARGESESLYRSELFTIDVGFFQSGEQEPLFFSALEERKGKGIRAATVKKNDVFIIGLGLLRAKGKSHPCPSEGGAGCEVSVEFIDAERTVHLVLVRELAIGTKGTDRLADLLDLDASVRLVGRIPVKVAKGGGVIAVSISISARPNPVFSYRIPVIIE